MSLGGEENRDPTVDAALEVLKRPRIQTPLPALRGSGVAAAGPTPYEDYLRTWGNVAPEVTTATQVSQTPAYSGGDSGGYSDSSTNPAWDAMSMSEKAAYYADNPTAGKVGRVAGDYFSNTPLGMMQNYFDPGIQTQSDAIMAGMDPTGWQFAERNNDGILGTQIGGTLSFPELSPENFGPYAFPTETAPTVTSYTGNTSDPYAETFLNTPEALAWASTPAVAPVMTDGVMSTTPVVSVSDFMANVANQAVDPMDALMGQLSAPAVQSYTTPTVNSYTTVDLSGGPVADASGSSYGGIVTDGSGRAITTGDGSGLAYGDGGVNAGDGGYGSGEVGYDAGDMGHGGGEGSSSSSKIICTAMNQAYGFGSFRNSIWLTYSAQHMTKAHEAGYHALFLPLVDYGFKRGDGKINMAVRKTLEWIARHRTKDLRAEMRGTKRDTTGRIIRFIFEPLCYAVGKLKGY